MKFNVPVETQKLQPSTAVIPASSTAELATEIKPDLQPARQNDPSLALEALSQQFSALGKCATDLYAQSAVLLAKIQAELPTVEAPTLGMERDRFIEHLSTNYGFTQEAGATMYKTLEAIEGKFPDLAQQEKDYLFNRLVGGFVYDGFKWDSTAGELKDHFPKQTHQEMFATLGIDEAEYNKLRYQVRIQNQLSSGDLRSWGFIDEVEDQPKYLKSYNLANKTNYTSVDFENIWDTQRIIMADKGDFAHQSITTATLLYEGSGTDLARLWLGSEKRVDEMSGWLGDATIQTKNNGLFKSKTVQFGADDYIADLDAANITHLMQRDNKDFLQTTDYYYNNYLTDGNSRATLFIEHTPYEYAEKHVLNEFLVGSFPGFRSYSLDELKSNQVEAYNFLMSIKNGDHEMKDY